MFLDLIQLNCCLECNSDAKLSEIIDYYNFWQFISGANKNKITGIGHTEWSSSNTPPPGPPPPVRPTKADKLSYIQRDAICILLMSSTSRTVSFYESQFLFYFIMDWSVSQGVWPSILLLPTFSSEYKILDPWRKIKGYWYPLIVYIFY